MSCGISCRCSSDPKLLWLWRRLAAIAPIRSLAWEPPYAAGVAQEMAKRQKRKKFNAKTKELIAYIFFKEFYGFRPYIQVFKPLFFFFFCFLGPHLPYGSSQARGRIRATIASHSNIGSEPCLQPIPQLMAMPDP